MQQALFKGLNEQEKEELRAEFMSSALFRRQLTLAVQSLADASGRASISEKAYESPNWAYKQADAVGYERAVSDVISLIASKIVP